MHLTATADDLAIAVASTWRDFPPYAAYFGRWVAASGLALIVAKCVLVALSFFSDAGVEGWFAELRSALAGCAVQGNVRQLGVELARGSWQRWRTGVAAKLLRRTGGLGSQCGGGARHLDRTVTDILCQLGAQESAGSARQQRTCSRTAQAIKGILRRALDGVLSGPPCGPPLPRLLCRGSGDAGARTQVALPIVFEQHRMAPVGELLEGRSSNLLLAATPISLRCSPCNAVVEQLAGSVLIASVSALCLVSLSFQYFPVDKAQAIHWLLTRFFRHPTPMQSWGWRPCTSAQMYIPFFKGVSMSSHLSQTRTM